MNKNVGVLFIAVLSAGLGRNGFAQAPSALGTPTATIVAAANGFLATLDGAQRDQAVFDFKDEAQRARWSNLPTSIVKREGLRMGDLTAPQRDAVRALLAAALSPRGYEKTFEIVEGDEALRRAQGRNMFGHDEYYVSFLGEPSSALPFMIQFGGHHLAINITLVGEHSTLAPTHTAAQPAIYEFEGKTVRPLGREADKAFALISSLDDAQRRQAILGFQVRDLVLGPGRDGQTIQPEGIQGSSLNEQQREMLLDLAGEWTGLMYEAGATAKLAEMRTHITDTWFAWSGPTTQGGAAYFRIQGPTAIIEYAPQSMDHIHTMYRDPTNDYGASWWKR